MRRLLAAMFTALVLGATPAAAVLFTLDLNNSGTAAGGTNYGNSRTYQVSSGSGANRIVVNMRASAWSWKDGKLTNAYLGSYKPSSGTDNGGLYVINRSEDQGQNNTHAIDNQAGRDFILFSFDKDVQLTSVVANAFALGGSVDNDLTVGRSASVTSAWNAAPTGWHNSNLTNMATLFQAQKHIDNQPRSNGSLDALRVLAPAGSSIVQGKVWMISASLVNSDRKTDAFKLDSLKFNRTLNMGILGPMPEPGTWVMMISGFGLIGATLRRRRAMATLSRI